MILTGLDCNVFGVLPIFKSSSSSFSTKDKTEILVPYVTIAYVPLVLTPIPFTSFLFFD